MSKTYKILAIVEADRITGPAKNLLEFAALSRHNNDSAVPDIETTVVTYCRNKQLTNPFINAAQRAGVQVRIINERYRFDLSVIPQLNRIIKEIAPDIVQTHSVKSHFLVRLSDLSKHFSWIAFHHGYTATDWKVSAYNYLDRWSLHKAEKIITMNDVFSQELVRQGVALAKISILHNAINPEWLYEINATDTNAIKSGLKIADDELMILSVGRLSQEKGMHDLIEAAWHLRKLQPNVKAKFVIVGDGPERNNLASLATKYGVLDSIIFAGQEPDVRAYFAAADLFLLPSHSEGSPNVLLEAMTAKLPIVATSVGGVPEIVSHDHSAFLVAPHDPVGLATALHNLLNNEVLSRRLAKNARTEIINKFAPEKRAKKLIEIYRQISPKFPEPKREAGLALQGFGKK